MGRQPYLLPRSRRMSCPLNCIGRLTGLLRRQGEENHAIWVTPEFCYKGRKESLTTKRVKRKEAKNKGGRSEAAESGVNLIIPLKRKRVENIEHILD